MRKIIGRIRQGWHVSHIVVVASVGVILATVVSVVFGGRAEWVSEVAGMEVELSGSVREDPEVDGSELTLRLDGLEVDGVAVEGAVFVQTGGRGAEVERSDRVVLRGVVTEGFGVFAGTMWRPWLVSVTKPDPPDVALVLRNWFSGLVRGFVPVPQVDLTMGYLLGQKRALPEDFSELLTVVGLTHIVVASGYNLSVLVGVARRIFGRVSRFAALFGGGLLVVIFMAITGLSASMTRAGLVSGLGLLVWFVGRKFHPVKLLLLAAALTLIWNPMYVLDLGWLLSFASFAGVMLVGPLLERYFYGEGKPNFLAAVVLETMAAQLCCLPIILYFSGSFSVVSVVANVLILPAIPAVMLLTFLTGCLAWLPWVAGMTGWLAGVILGFHIWVVEFFGSLEWATVEVGMENPWVFVGYGVILLMIWWMKWRTGFSFAPRYELDKV